MAVILNGAGAAVLFLTGSTGSVMIPIYISRRFFLHLPDSSFGLLNIPVCELGRLKQILQQRQNVKKLQDLYGGIRLIPVFGGKMRLQGKDQICIFI